MLDRAYWQARHDRAMRMGRLYDKLSDRGFRVAGVECGTHYGNLAIRKYTEAERIAEEHLGDDDV